MIRRRPRRLPPPPSQRRCMAGGCHHPRSAARPFCASCWFSLPVGIRMEIDRLRAAGHKAHELLRDGAAWLARQASRATRSTPAVALCGRCRRASLDPVVNSCSDPRCPLAVEELAA